MKILIALILLSGCTSHLYDVNNRVNAYKYMDSNSRAGKAPTQFYKDGGGNCLDYAKAKQAELGGEIVILPEIIDGRTHAILKVSGWLLDSRFNELKLAALEKTYAYTGDK